MLLPLALVLGAAVLSAAQPFYVGRYCQVAQVQASGGGVAWGTVYYDSLAGVLLYVRGVSDNPSNGIIQPRRVTGRGGPTSPVNTGDYVSMLEDVNGNVALSFFNSVQGSLCYMRSTSVPPVGWGDNWSNDIQVIDNTPNANVGMWTSMAKLASGFPAIAYQDNSIDPVGGVKFVSANDVDGATWSAPIRVVQRAGAGESITLLVADGNPAIVFYDAYEGQLYWVRASDATGSTWDNATTLIDFENTGRHGALAKAAVNASGFPYVVYRNEATGTLKMAVGQNTAGTSWSVVDGPPGSLVTCVDLSFIVGTGAPVLSYGVASAATKQMLLATATTVTGSAWLAPLQLQDTVLTQFTSIAVVGNKPTVVWNDVEKGWLRIRQTTDEAGTVLAPALIVDNGTLTQTAASVRRRSTSSEPNVADVEMAVIALSSGASVVESLGVLAALILSIVVVAV